MDIRWQQRYQNYHKSFSQLKKALQISKPSDVERAGLIQFFELTFELGWKTLKDYLEAQGFQVNSPREVIKQAYQANVVTQGHVWMAALDDRNLTAHTYEESTSIKVEDLIRSKYFLILEELDIFFATRLSS